MLPALALARLLPDTGAGLWVRLALATALVLLPGMFAARALRVPGAASTLTWSLAIVAVALMLTFAVGGSLSLTAAVVAGAGVVAFAVALRAPRPPRRLALVVVVLAGIGLGIALWSLVGVLQGDALFHLARVRKLDDFGNLSLRSVDEFRDGGLHPGYAFPLWHGFLALVARAAGVDPTAVVTHEGSLLCPLAFAVLYEAGAAVFRSAAAGVAVLAGQIGLSVFAAGHGGAYALLALPATAARQLLAFALVALFFAHVREPTRASAASVAAAAGALAFVHPTYVLFVALVLGGYVLVRIVVERGELLVHAAAVAAVAIPTAGVLAWLSPIIAETAAHNPSTAELHRALDRYNAYLVISSDSRYHLNPAVFTRTGALAVAALAVLPLAGFAARRRWGALVLGGSLVLLAVELVPFLFPRFADTVSLSQARRAAGFLPIAFALAGGAVVLARASRLLVLPLALGAGIALQLAYPGDFSGDLSGGSPTWPVWLAVAGGTVALAVAVVLRRPAAWERRGLAATAAVVLLVIPVAVHGFSHWSERNPTTERLTPGLLRFLRTQVPKRAVVFSDLETSYDVSAYAPVYVAAAPPAHVADTRANRPQARRDDVAHFYSTGSLAIPRKYGAGWLVIDRTRPHPQVALRPDYRDKRFSVFRL